MGPHVRWFWRAVVFVCFVIPTAVFSQQISPRPLITQPVDESQLTTLTGNTHPLARAQFDVGAAAPDLMIHRMLLVLRRSPEQEHVLRALLDDQQDKASPQYHKWLTPDQFGAQFGPADQDMQVITGWLQSHGFQVNRVSHGRTVIEFSGTEGQVEEAFHTAIHKYQVNGEEHWANASDPQIPTALAPAIAGFASLNNFPRKPLSIVMGTYSPKTRTVTPVNPQFTFGSGNCFQGTCYAVGPADFGAIYNVQTLWNSGIDGTGQTIAIVAESDINLQDIRDFRALFGLPPKDPNVIYDGPNPGLQQDESEADIDAQWSGAIAPNATIDFVVSQSTETSFGVDLSAVYIIDNNLAPVMSESYGICELGLGTSGNQFYNTLWAQAAAQGISVILASGDSGSNGCTEGVAQYGLNVSGFASTPFNTAIGGTDFNDLLNPTQYWNASNASATQESAKGYIPETTWNLSCTNSVLLGDLNWPNTPEANCNNSQLINAGLVDSVGGSGGKSNCTTNSQQLGSCSGGYTKPSWQVASGVPSDGKRDIPDISFFASNGVLNNFYIFCEADSFANCAASEYGAAGGTSFGAPIFAGVMALINQKMNTPEGQGVANYVLYKLAGQQTASSCNSWSGSGASCVFNDITSGTIAMPCVAGSPDCTVQTAGHQYGILSGYSTTTGYDLATGLGSVNVANLVNKWNSVTFRPTTTTLSLTPTSGLTHGQSVTVTGTVAPSTGTGTPSGNVSLLTSTGVSVDGFALSNGAISADTKLLPGGTYTVFAHYAGDPTFGGSDSTPVSVTVGKENSSVKIGLVTFDWNGNLSNPNATSAVYGSPYVLRADVLDSAGNACESASGLPQFGCPTGSLTFADNANPLAGTYSLNSLGYTEDPSPQLPGGSNSVSAQYSGDASFNAGSTTANLSITSAPTTTVGTFYSNGAVGADYEAYATVQSQSSGAIPTGTVTFYANGKPIPGTVVYASDRTSTSPPTVTLYANLYSSSSPFPAPGNYTLTASYSGDTNYQASNFPGTTLFVGFATPTVNLQSSSNAVNAGSSVTLVATVVGGSPSIAPTGTISISGANAGTLSGAVSYATVKDAKTGNLDLQGTLTITPGFTDGYFANYSGDSNYPVAGVCCATIVTVNGNDFVFSAKQSSATVNPGSSTSYPLLVGFQSNTAPVSFSCSGLPSEASCSISPNPDSSTISMNLGILTTASNSVLPVKGSSANLRYLWLSSMLPIAAILLIGCRRTGPSRPLSRVLLSCLLLVGIACGGGGGSTGGGGGGGGSTPPGAPASLTATAISSSKINLGWYPSTGATSYVVYRSTTNGFAPSSSNRIASTNESSFYPDSGLSPATMYYYVVEASNGTALSSPSNQASASTQAFDPGTPAGTYNITVTATSGSISHSVNLTLVVN